MAFDEVSFPLRLAAGSGGGPSFMTEVVTTQGGYERRNQGWSQPRRRYDARSGVVTAQDAALLIGFFQARAGRARGFRLHDWSDYTSVADGNSVPDSSDQVIGTGDNATTQFQLVKNYGSGNVTFAREIRKPTAGSVRIGVDGVEYLTEWSVDVTTGVVTFAQPPALGAVITAGFAFDVPVRFDIDTLTLATRDTTAVQAEIPLIEVRV